jgi:hypothetical protein
MKKVYVEIPDGKSAKWINGVLTFTDDEPKDIKDRVKTFDDACAVVKEFNPALVEQYEAIDDVDRDLTAFLKLRIICAALNEGWTPQLKDGEYRWYPWFYLYTQDELDNMDKEEKHSRRGLLLGGNANDGSNAGLGYAYYGSYAGLGFTCSYNAPSGAYAHVGSRLCLKNEDLSDYCGKQFIEIWSAFLFPERPITKSNWEE